MSDAWNSPGWTAQKDAYYYTDDSALASWRLPEDVVTVKVAAAIGEIDGGLPQGHVLFAASSALRHIPSGRVLKAPRFLARISRTGNVSLKIPATDNTTLVPLDEGFTYAVEIVIGRKAYKRFECELPRSVTEVDLFDLAPTDPDVEDFDGGGPDSEYADETLDGGVLDETEGITL